MTNTAGRKLAITVAAMVSGGLLLIWLVFDRCYCSWNDASFETPAHVKSLSQGCEVLTLPEPWRSQDGTAVTDSSASLEVPGHQFEAPTFEDYEFRRSPSDASVVYLALRTRSPALAAQVQYSVNKFSFRFPALLGKSDARILDLKPLPQAEWNAGNEMPLLAINDIWERVQNSPERFTQQGPVRLGGRVFEGSDSHYWGASIPSSNLRRLAVLSYGNGRMEVGNSTGLGSDFLLPRRWHSYSVDLYDVASEQPIGWIRTWSCWNTSLRQAQWHGDQIFSVPIRVSAQLLVVCGFSSSSGGSK